MKSPVATPLQADPNPPARVIQRVSDRQWQLHPVAGVKVAPLYEDQFLEPLEPVPFTEEIYMLSGDLILDDGTVLQAGDYLRSDPGSSHTPVTESGCLFFFHASLDDCVMAGAS